MKINTIVQSYNPYQVERAISDAGIKNEAVQKMSSADFESKVERIKREIEEGTYKVDLEKTASAIANSLLGN